VPLWAQPAGPYSGRSVQAVIDELRAAGAPLVYSTNLLPDSLRVTAEPMSREPLTLARELLQPHGLTLREEAGVWLVVRAEPPAVPTGAIVVTVLSAGAGEAIAEATIQVDESAAPRIAATAGRAELAGLMPGRRVLTVRATGFLPERVVVSVAAGDTAAVEVALLEAVPKLDEVTVTASRYDLINDVQPSASYFSRDDIENLADLGDDTLRAAHRLPGIAASEFSARSHVRGGATDEMTVMLDGMELIEPFHLRDYASVFSAIDQRIVSGLQIYSGGYPAAYGDALSGLMLIEPREPTELAHEIGVSLLHTAVLSSGTFADGRGSWLASARRSNLGEIIHNERGEPTYHDVFARVGMDVGAKHRLTVNSMGFDDDIVMTPVTTVEEREEGRGEVDSRQFWIVLDSDWTAALSSRTWLYANEFSSLRREIVVDPAELRGTVHDGRDLEAEGIKQEWRFEPSDRQLLTWGFQAEDFDALYQYASAIERFGLLATLGGTAPPARAVALTATGDRQSAYFGDRIRLSERLLAELGVRWDRQTYSPGGSDDQFSPRSSLLYRLGSRTDLRLSYGRFFQADRLLDLQVEDGVSEFGRAQNASHSIIGVDHRFSGALGLRVEAFRKWTHDARPRFENLFDPLVLVAELRASRVGVTPERGEARGVEVVLDGGGSVPWWLGYSVSEVDDVIAGERVPRSWDQRIALDAGVNWDVGLWSLSAAASLHSGWPATEVTVAQVDGQPVAVAGARNALRLRPLRRIDFRASRDLAGVHIGTFRLFTELTNITNRRNPCCLVYEEVTTADGASTLSQSERAGLPLTLNVGLLWEF